MDPQQLAKEKSLPLETVEEIIRNFSEFDLDNNGYITPKELGDVFHSVGIDLPGYEIRELIKKIDKNNDNRVELSEFFNLYCEIKNKEVAKTFRKAISKKEGISALAGTSHTSAEGTTHSVAEAEKVAFANFINKKLAGDEEARAYLPISEATNDIYKKVDDGILLCKMINASVADTVDERAINRGKKLNIYTKQENLTLALNSARAIGCNIVNIGAEDLNKGTPHLVLGLLWQIIRVGLFAKIDLHEVPGLMRLLREGEDINTLLSLSPEELLIRWVNYHMEQAGSPRRINNFGEDIKDSEVYDKLLRQIAPKEIQLGHVPQSAPPLDRAEAVLDNAELMKCRQFVTPQDVVNGNQKLNMAFVANLFNTYPALEAPDEELEEFEETREEKTFRNWMNSLGVSPHVNRLFTDLCNGLILLQLIEIVKGDPNFVDPKRVNKMDKLNKPGGNMKKVENCNYAVDLCKGMKFSLVGIGGNDIYDGNDKLTLAVVWQLMRAYTLRLLSKVGSVDGKISDKAVVDAVNNKLEAAGKTSRITGFQDQSIADSRVVLELVDAIRDKSVNWANYNESASSDEEMLGNAKYALSMARKIGAAVYALPEDIVEVKPKMVMTVFACLIAVAKAEEEREDK
ncbi:plastin-3-like [Acanthaster planci]|uniref:Plastin-3-like n=1 Tax=Acanthaster planci TaxID=133434 RepID=A0A8B7YGZ5_ACAPL|nr:plastin-3-like [Acanthaster planci]